MKHRKKPWQAGEMAFHAEFVHEEGKPDHWSVRARRLTAWDSTVGCFVIWDGRYSYAIQFDTLAKARQEAWYNNWKVFREGEGLPEEHRAWWKDFESRLLHMGPRALQDGEILI